MEYLFDSGSMARSRRIRLALDGERIAQSVTRAVRAMDWDCTRIAVKATNPRDRPTAFELDAIKKRANEMLFPAARVRRLRTDPHGYIGRDFYNSYDGDIGKYVAFVIATLGAGVFVVPLVYHLWGGLNPTAYYHVDFRVRIPATLE